MALIALGTREGAGSGVIHGIANRYIPLSEAGEVLEIFYPKHKGDVIQVNAQKIDSRDGVSKYIVRQYVRGQPSIVGFHVSQKWVWKGARNEYEFLRSKFSHDRQLLYYNWEARIDNKRKNRDPFEGMLDFDRESPLVAPGGVFRDKIKA